MKSQLWVFALVMLLLAANAAWANFSPVAFNTDPGFYQVYWAKKVAAPLALTAMAIALVWLCLRPTRTNAYVVGVFLLLVIGSAFIRSEFLDLRNEPFPTSGYVRGRHAPEKLGHVSAHEAAIFVILVSAVLCFGGHALARRHSRSTTPATHAPDSPSDFSNR